MRACGILLPVFSLPSPYGIGCFSKEAYRFVDWLVEAGQTYWQILPLGPTGYGDSPYQPFSAFAGNAYFIDLEALVEEGLLCQEECEEPDWADSPVQVDYGRLYGARRRILRQAFERAHPERDPAFLAYCQEEAGWLDDYSLFMAVKRHFGEKSWDQWERDIRMREPEAMERYRALCADEIRFHQFLQYRFFQQWSKLKEYANRKGIRMIGDIPIYVAFDGADSWAHPELFQFDEERRPIRVAGCPPDAFSAEGQLWGNPLYRWEYHEQTGYGWWIERMEHCFRLYDVVRVDHFRGFDEYYAIPYGDATAADGSWEKGPGMKLFGALRAHFEEVPIIAEDLGYLTDSVKQLVRESGYPGMKIMEFAFDSREAGDYMPYNYDSNCVVYTGTHDNQTLVAWLGELLEQEQELVREYLGAGEDCPEQELVWALIRLTLGSVADTAVIPMQDYLCLGEQARINRPSTLGGNWKWRMPAEAADGALACRLRRLAHVYGRLGG